MVRIRSNAYSLSFIFILMIHVLSLSSKFKIKDNYKASVQNSPISIKFKKLQKAITHVNTIKSKEDKKVETKFASKDDNFFHRQTKAKKTASFTQGAKGIEKAAHHMTAAQIMKQLTKKKTQKKKKGFGLKEFKKFSQSQKKISQTFKMKKGTRFGSESEFGVAADNSVIEEIPLSNFTRINTARSKYFGYFAGIRKKIESHWGQSIQDKLMKMYFKQTRIPASKKFITDLLVTLNAKGEIIKLNILSKSGKIDLDDAALEAFNKAGPFPNPPQGLIKNGEVDMKWGFIVN